MSVPPPAPAPSQPDARAGREPVAWLGEARWRRGGTHVRLDAGLTALLGCGGRVDVWEFLARCQVPGLPRYLVRAARGHLLAPSAQPAASGSGVGRGRRTPWTGLLVGADARTRPIRVCVRPLRAEPTCPVLRLRVAAWAEGAPGAPPLASRPSARVDAADGRLQGRGLTPEDRAVLVPRLAALGAQTAGVVHDLNNVLGGILGAVDLIGDEIEGQPRGPRAEDHPAPGRPVDWDVVRELLGAMRSSAERAQLLTRTVLVSVRLSADPSAELGPAALDPSAGPSPAALEPTASNPGTPEPESDGRAEEFGPQAVQLCLGQDLTDATAFAPAPLAPGVVWDGLLRLVRASLPSTIVLQAEPLPALAAVPLGAVGLQQALLNLSSNAVHAMRGTTGRLTVRARTRRLDSGDPRLGTLPPGGYLLIEVSDTGVGMSPATLDRATEAFYTTKPAGEGTGLGLAVVRDIVHTAGGRLRLTSELGQGTTITLVLPQAPSPWLPDTPLVPDSPPGLVPPPQTDAASE